MREALERCAREQAELQARPDAMAGTAPAWLMTLAMEDWEREKELIEREAKC